MNPAAITAAAAQNLYTRLQVEDIAMGAHQGGPQHQQAHTYPQDVRSQGSPPHYCDLPKPMALTHRCQYNRPRVPRITAPACRLPTTVPEILERPPWRW
ncbi:hypothetical protein XM38_023500 [Halomicronema hongdechloris C2206]|uniref:Uncharacterized protein n=1 Tax=Halomicronema hongdechloris C2206 TaxID=1641165 RepID=A0A1Z3HM82_9CYAN|nr:hypothetical protein XM38_023500 [Halomicronema hongdechloris C2206]